MILYNTIVGLAAGVGLLLVVKLLNQFTNGEKVQSEAFCTRLWHHRLHPDRLGPGYLDYVAVHQGASCKHHDGRAGFGLWGIAWGRLAVHVAETRSLR